MQGKGIFKVNIGRISKIANFHPIGMKFEDHLVIEFSHQLFLRSNLFEEFPKYHALHDIFLVCSILQVYWSVDFVILSVCLFVNRLQVTILNRSSRNLTTW